MPVLAGNPPIYLTHRHKSCNRPLVLRVDDYLWDRLGNTTIVQCEHRGMEDSTFPSLDRAANQAYQRLKWPYNGEQYLDELKACVVACASGDDARLKAAAEAAEGQQLRDDLAWVGLKLAQPYGQAPPGSVQLPVRRLLPLVRAGTSTDAIGRMMAGGAPEEPAPATAPLAVLPADRRPVNVNARKGAVVFFTGQPWPHLVVGVVHRPEREIAPGVKESGKHLGDPKWIPGFAWARPPPAAAGEIMK